MKVEDRRCQLRDGKHKLRYTKQGAKNMQRHLKARGFKVLDIYRCEVCGWWHMGNRPLWLRNTDT